MPQELSGPTLEDHKWYVINKDNDKVDLGLGGFDCYFDADAAGRRRYQAHIVMRGKHILADARWNIDGQIRERLINVR